MENTVSSSNITYFLMKERTENQILERLGNVGINTVKNLKTLGFVKTRSEGTETFYELNSLAKITIFSSPAYWHYVLKERLRSL